MQCSGLWFAAYPIEIGLTISKICGKLSWSNKLEIELDAINQTSHTCHQEDRSWF